jgi:ATP-dependent helicase/nuclease subunit B
MGKKIRQFIEQGFTIVTPTKRLGRSLQQHYISGQLSEQKKVWETPDILPWAAWIMRLWEDFAAQQESLPMLLNTQQQKWVWQQLISDSSHAEKLLHASATASQAYDALKNARQWQIEIFPNDLWLTKDAFAFKSWVKSYDQACEKNGWMDAASLEIALLDISPECATQYAAKLCLVGFDELTPAQQSLLKALEKAGSDIKHLQELHRSDQTTEVIQKSDQVNKVIRTTFADSRYELKAIAHWIRDHLETNDDISIGVIVPELENIRSDIENIFDDVLTPGNLFSYETQTQNHRPYNLSLGKPLADYPVINAAFAILGLEKKAIALEDLGALLRSPFIKSAETEMIVRAQLDAHLREQGESAVFLTILQQRLEKDEFWSEHCPQLTASLQQWREVFQSLPRKQNCTAWIESFIALLNTLGWPGERQIQEDEFQTIEAWRGLLDQFSSLDLVSGELTYNGAFSLLQRLAREQNYQVETGEVPVQVMGLLEAAGMQFDHLWVMGLHEENWPPTAKANPFIPIKLQRQEKMPHASAERELEYACRITSRLAASANKVIFSSPLSEAGRELRPSPLLKHYPLQISGQKIQLHSEINYAASIFTSSKIEHFHDERAPKIKEAQASGGTGLFKDQAACPFRAFAKHRLGARSLAEADIGLSPMERGQLVHNCLQLFWEKISTHKKLIELTDGALALHINECAAKVIKRFQAQRPFTATERFMLIEQGRLQAMMREWLSLERQRRPFIVIEREQKHFCTIEGLKILTRMDRVDQLPDGSLIVIDYKTSKVALASWMDERPDEPQLPLYAITGEGNIVAVVFGQIKRGEMKFVGLVDDAYGEGDQEENNHALIPDVKTLSKSRVSKKIPDWQALFMFWEQNLITLAKNYQKGDARVDPHKVNTCMYCDLGTLCRINELTQSIIELSGDENE